MRVTRKRRAIRAGRAVIWVGERSCRNRDQTTDRGGWSATAVARLVIDVLETGEAEQREQLRLARQSVANSAGPYVQRIIAATQLRAAWLEYAVRAAKEIDRTGNVHQLTGDET